MPDDADHLVPLADIEAARERIAGLVHRTPLLSSATAGAWTTRGDRRRGSAGDRHLPEGGAPPEDGLVQGPRDDEPDPDAVARGPRARARSRCRPGTPARPTPGPDGRPACAMTVTMPAGAVRTKVDACLGYGARVVLHGAHVGETLAELERIRDAEGLEFVHPFDDPAVIAGHGSVGFELRRRPARRRRRGRRGRWRRPDLGRRGGGQGAAPDRARLRRRTRAVERDEPRPRTRRGRPDPARQRRRRTRGAVRGRLDAGDVPALPRRHRPARRRRRSSPGCASRSSG